MISQSRMIKNNVVNDNLPVQVKPSALALSPDGRLHTLRQNVWSKSWERKATSQNILRMWWLIISCNIILFHFSLFSYLLREAYLLFYIKLSLFILWFIRKKSCDKSTKYFNYYIAIIYITSIRWVHQFTLLLLTYEMIKKYVNNKTMKN